MLVLSEAQYLPPIPFFSQLLTADALLLDIHEHYHKQTYRNRCLIRTAQGIQPLTVPVIDGNRSEKVRTVDIEIDYRQNWIHRHWRTLQTAYGNSPYFEYYADYLHDIYREKPARLFDLNLNFLRLLFRCLRLPTPIEFTTEYQHPIPTSQQPTHLPLDRRDFLTPKTVAFPGPDTPTDSNQPLPYRQVFGPPFVPGLSVLDLLFAQGPAAGSFL